MEHSEQTALDKALSALWHEVGLVSNRTVYGSLWRQVRLFEQDADEAKRSGEPARVQRCLDNLERFSLKLRLLNQPH